MDERKAKGVVANGYLKFIKRKWGIMGLNQAMEYAGIKRELKDGEWFSMTKTDKLLEWIGRNKGMEYVKEAGRYTAKDMGIFRYMFASIMGIERLLKRAQDAYRTMFNFGMIDMEIEGKKARITFRKARLTEYSCIAWEGALQGLMEVTHSHGTVKHLEPENPDDCAFEMRWD
jgi:hypothetical protein